jgi:hypothetical protein
LLDEDGGELSVCVKMKQKKKKKMNKARGKMCLSGGSNLVAVGPPCLLSRPRKFLERNLIHLQLKPRTPNLKSDTPK